MIIKTIKKTFIEMLINPFYQGSWFTALFFILFKLKWDFLIISIILWFLLDLIFNLIKLNKQLKIAKELVMRSTAIRNCRKCGFPKFKNHICKKYRSG